MKRKGDELEQQEKKKLKIFPHNGMTSNEFLFLTFAVPLKTPPPCDGSIPFVDVHHFNLAGFGLPDDRRLYVRDEWSKLWIQLNGTSNFSVIGPPGIGKSSLIWSWCCHLGNAKDIRWIHIPRMGGCDLVDFSKGSITHIPLEEQKSIN